MNEEILPWQAPGWPESARDWIREQLAGQNIILTGDIEQPHIRPWSTVMTVPTSEGVMYFKASAEYISQETALTDYLSKFRPEIFPALLAVDLDRHWMLMRGAGTPLRKFIKTERSVRSWGKVLPYFINLQKDLIPRIDDLLALGMMDRRLAKLPEMFEDLIADKASMLLNQSESLTSDEYARLRTSLPEFRRMCEKLALFGISETIHHDDFHDGNIFLLDGKVQFTDWGESAVTHPFFTLVVMLRSVENTLDLPPDAPEVLELRNGYLSSWTDYASLAELQSIISISQRIGYVNRALTWKMVISHLPESLKPEYALAVPSYLHDFISTKE